MSSCLASSATQPVTLSKPTTRLRGGPSLPRRQPQHCTSSAVRAKPRPFLSVHPVSIQQPSTAAQRHCRLPSSRRPCCGCGRAPNASSAPCDTKWYAAPWSAHPRPPYTRPSRRAAPARLVERLAVRQPAACCLRSPQSHPVSPPLLSLMISISISVHCTPDAGGAAAPAGAACLLRPCTLRP